MSPPRKAKVSPPHSLNIQIDGAARGNPGPAGAGVLLCDPRGKKLKELSVYLGEATNNVAETCALVLALQEALRFGGREVKVLSDSELLVRQVNGRYKVREKHLQWMHALIRHLLGAFEKFEIRHVPRGENKLADRLANRAVDQGLKGQMTLFVD